MESLLMTISQFRTEFDRALTYYRSGNYGEAYHVTDQLLVSFPLSVELLLLRARVIQLLEDADLAIYPAATLDLAYESLQTATLLAPQNADALHELGYFALNIQDRAPEALEYFKSAERAATTNLFKVLVGQMRCLQDLGDTEGSDLVSKKISSVFPDEILPFLDLE